MNQEHGHRDTSKEGSLCGQQPFPEIIVHFYSLNLLLYVSMEKDSILSNHSDLGPRHLSTMKLRHHVRIQKTKVLVRETQNHDCMSKKKSET